MKLVIRYSPRGEAVSDYYARAHCLRCAQTVREVMADRDLPGDEWTYTFSTLNMFCQFFLADKRGELEGFDVFFVDELAEVEIPVSEAYERGFFNPMLEMVTEVRLRSDDFLK